MLKEFIEKLSLNDGFKRLTSRYLLPWLYSVAGGMWFCIALNHNGIILKKPFQAIGIYLAIAGVCCLIQQLSAFRFSKEKTGVEMGKSIGVQAIVQAFAIAEAILLITIDLSIAAIIGHAVFLTAIAYSIVYLPFTLQKTDTHLLQWSVDTLIMGMIVGLIQAVLNGSILGLLEGICALFGFDINETLRVDTAVILVFVVGSALLFMLMPTPEENSPIADKTKVLIKRLGLYLLFPITVVYLLVLYAYLLKIIIQWQLPDGGVVWMTTGMMALFFNTIILLYPQWYHEKEQSRFTQIVRFAFPLATLAPLGLMVIAIARRISDYGWTPSRGYVVVGLLWFFFAIAFLLWAAKRSCQGKETKVITGLIASVSALLIIVSCIPHINIYEITKRHEEKTEVKSWAETHKTYYEYDSKSKNGEIAIPEGYSKVSFCREYDYQQTEETRDANGHLVLRTRIGANATCISDWVYLHFDEKQDTTNQYVELYTEKGDLLRAYQLTIIEDEGKYYINDMEAMRFSK